MNNITNKPTLDMHGMDREYGKLALLEFINDHKKMKTKEIVIVHGIGKGILRDMVLDTLRHNKDVLEYHIDYFNSGSTIVKLKID